MPMISPEQAWELLRPYLSPLPEQRLDRRRAAGRVLAEGTRATVDVPAFDLSAMDGFILPGDNARGAELPVSGMVTAGDAPGSRLAPGTAMRIMTGAAVPTGGDRVLPVEETEVSRGGDGAERVRLLAPATEGDHIRRRGEVIRSGEPLLPAGALLTPGALSLLATHGIREVAVHRAPRIAVVVTGDEVVEPDAEPGPGQLRDSHTDFLLAAAASLGLELTPLGIAPDRLEELRELVRRGLGYDVLLLTGGVSMGELDLVEDVLGDLGCTSLFDRVAIQPGKPVVAAHHRGGLVFGLPGNPASAMVVFWLFVRPALRRLLGVNDGYWQGALQGELEAELPFAKGRDKFLPARVRFRGSSLLVTPLPPLGSHDLGAYGRGNALVRIPANAEATGPGERCEVLPFADWRDDGGAR